MFLVLFDYFRVPPGPMQDKALAFGLYGAVVCRGIFVALGAVALQNFRGVLLVFAGILLFTSGKILLLEDGDDSDDVADNDVVKWVNSQTLVPSTDAFDAEDPSRFFTLGADGVRRATPLLAAVACLELSDVVFAVDSVPAVFGVTEDPFIVYTSNMFARGVVSRPIPSPGPDLVADDPRPGRGGAPADPRPGRGGAAIADDEHPGAAAPRRAITSEPPRRFAILGLRAWYAVLAQAAQDLAYRGRAEARARWSRRLLSNDAHVDAGTSRRPSRSF